MLSSTVSNDVPSCGFRGSFFFQAEDGIRDLVRSRGLGDVYKRQDQPLRPETRCLVGLVSRWDEIHATRKVSRGESVPVSYTHLTLPTSDLV